MRDSSHSFGSSPSISYMTTSAAAFGSRTVDTPPPVFVNTCNHCGGMTSKEGTPAQNCAHCGGIVFGSIQRV